MTIEYLVPSANATTTTTQILATNNYLLIDEGSPNGLVTDADGSVNNTNVDNTSAAGTDAIWALTDLSTTPTSINSATFRVRARTVNPGSGDTYTYTFALAIGGDTINLTWSNADENGGFVNRTADLSTETGYPYTEAQFNAATVTLTQSAYVKDMGPDGFYLDIDAIELEVDWTAIATPITVTPLGVESTGEVDSAILHGKANTTVAGVEVTGAAGIVTYAEGKTVLVTGLEVTGQVEPVSVLAVQAPTVLVTGLEGTSEVDSAAVLADANLAVLGVEGTAETDSVLVQAEAIVTVSSVEATSEIGSVTVDEGAVTWEQEGFRFRNDDGTEITATWVAVQDTSVSLVAETNYRLRVTSVATGNPPLTNATLQYRKVGDTDWQTIQ